MNPFEEAKTLLREKNGQKLVALSTAVFLLITAIVFFAACQYCWNTHLKQLDSYLSELPKVFERLSDELQMRSRVYEDDTLARAELGRMLYAEAEGKTEEEKLEQVRSEVRAASVSLLDGQGQLVAGTGHVCPDEVFQTRVPTLEAGVPCSVLYPAREQNAEEEGEEIYDGSGFVLLPLTGNAKRSLVFEFSAETVTKLHNDLADWSELLAQILLHDSAAAFAKTGDKLAGYPMNSFTVDEVTRLYGELEQVFQNRDSFREHENGSSDKLITLLGHRYLAALAENPQSETDILMTLPLKDVLRNGMFIAAAISAILGWGILLLQVYVFRRVLQKKDEVHAEVVTRKWACKATWPGILVVLVVTAVFSTMLLLLESQSQSSSTALAKRTSIQYEIDWREEQSKAIRKAFTDVYRLRAQTLADFVSRHPDYRTRAGLEALNRIARSDYLMLFDRDGQELAASNSYTGFSVSGNLGEEFQALLKGYPDAAAGPAADPYTGQMQLSTAILLTDAEGQPDGFLLAVYSAGELNAECRRMSYENTVNSFAVPEGHFAAAVSNEDGSFIAHTDPKMIGLQASDYLANFEAGKSFEGFTAYGGKDVYASASSADGKTLLYIVPERGKADVQAVTVLLALAVLVVLTVLYYPNASLLVVRVIAEAKGKLRQSPRTKNAMVIFADGYSVFLTLFTFFVLLASENGWWTSFDYVFSRGWSKGVHLFSIWSALFVLAVTKCLVFVLRLVLLHLEQRLSLQGKTIARLAGSLLRYAAAIFLLFTIFDMFGANTTTLLASAGIVSIAVGMGAQSMASDLLAGFFMMLEDSVRVGDHVKVSGVTGTVTDMGIRTTEITDEDGNVVILNNSHVGGLCNMSRHAEKQDAGIEESSAPDAGGNKA